MLQHALKIGLVVLVAAVFAQDANAFGRWGGCGWGRNGCGGCGFGGYGGGGYGGWYGGYGNGSWAYAGFGGYGGWGAPGYGYTGNLSNGYSSPVARPKANTSSSAQPATDSVMLTVNVPADAKVFVNGRATTSVGELRQYTSAGLQHDAAYRYRVRAEFIRDGKPVSEEKTVSIVAGQTASLAFNSGPEAQVADADAAAQR